MRPQRPCLDCGALHRNPGPRCGPHERAHQKAKNRKAGYRRTREWQELSAEARAAHPWCAHCGATEDLVTDHIANRSLDLGVQVLCRPCNSRKGTR